LKKLKITFVHVGPIKKAAFREAFGEYLRRIGRYTAVEVLEVRQGPSSRKTPVEETLKREAGRIEKALGSGGYNVALAEGGRSFDSKGFARFIGSVMDGGVKNLTFIISGPFGLHRSVTEGARMTLALSKMTLPHEMAGVVLAEQTYRAFTILRGESYSH